MAHTPNIEEKIEELRMLHKAGMSSLRKSPTRMNYGESDVRAKEAQLPKEYLTKARVFASKEKGYTQADLKELFALMREHQHPIGVGYIFKLLRVRKDQRPSIQREAFLHRWSVAELKAQIHARFGNRQQAAGRKPVILMTAKGVESALLQATQKWERLYAHLRSPGAAGNLEGGWHRLTPLQQRLGDDIHEGMKGLLRSLEGRFPKTPKPH